MKISICGSMAFIDQMEMLATELRKRGFAVSTPVREERMIAWNSIDPEEAIRLKSGYISGYLQEIRSADFVLIANYKKSGVAGYIGANSLIEAAFAYALGIPVIFLFEPGHQACRLEALAMMNSCLNGAISGFDEWRDRNQDTGSASIRE
jgi:hypothetical protein